MNDIALITERLGLAAAIVLAMAGVLAAWTSPNAAKRLAAIVVAMVGAVIALGVLGAPEGVLLAGVAAGFAYIAVGVALVVRLQEAHSVIEAPEIDVADARDEAPPPQ